MMLVMVSLSVSLVLTYAILQTQTVTSQVSQNALRTDLASQAAQTGAAIALERMQSLDWKGVDQPLYQVIHSDGDGYASYTVEFQKDPRPAVTPEFTGDPALIVRVSSLGVWQSYRDANQKAARTVEVLVTLEPRLPGRGIVSEDNAAAEDVAANPGDYDQIQKYALVAHGQNGNISLTFDPGDRIDGKVWVEQKIKFYHDPTWSKSIRELVLQEIGKRYIRYEGDKLVILHPHPFGGPVMFRPSVDGGTQSDLARLGVPWSGNKQLWNWPAKDLSQWQRYRLYKGGFEYAARTLPSSLERVTLRPSPDNPLGVFYARGALTIRNDVTIQGTLVCDGTINVTGNRVRICSYNWRDTDGKELLSDAKLMPRLPAIVGQNLFFSRETTALVEGAVVVSTSVTGAGGTYDWNSGPYGQVGQYDILGKATARPLQQPYSEVKLTEGPALSSMSGGEEFAIWLTDGGSGTWHPITAVNSTAGTLTIVGEASFDSPTPYRIRRTRKRSVDIRGPVAGEWYDFNRPDDWGNLTSSQWEKLYAAWLATGVLNLDGKSRLPPTIPFLDFLANPLNFPLGVFSQSYSRFGLTLEPTFHLRHTGDVFYRWSPPLFEAYYGTADNSKHAGYRWKVLSWREIEGTAESAKAVLVESWETVNYEQPAQPITNENHQVQ